MLQLCGSCGFLERKVAKQERVNGAITVVRRRMEAGKGGK